MFAITEYIHQFFLNKTGDHSLLLVRITIIKHANFKRIIYQILYNIFHWIFAVVDAQLFFPVYFAKQ